MLWSASTSCVQHPLHPLDVFQYLWTWPRRWMNYFHAFDSLITTNSIIRFVKYSTICSLVDCQYLSSHLHPVIIFTLMLENSSACFRTEQCLLRFMGHFMLPFPLVGNMCHFYNTVKLKCWGEMLSDVSVPCKRKRLAQLYVDIPVLLQPLKGSQPFSGSEITKPNICLHPWWVLVERISSYTATTLSN